MTTEEVANEEAFFKEGPRPLDDLLRVVRWPDPPGKPAFAGIAGEVVNALDPHTEANPNVVLLQFLTSFGNAIGPGPHCMVGATRHPLRLYSVVVGETAKARKGDSWSPLEAIWRIALPDWANKRIQSGLSSGEGLIWAVRDPIYKKEPTKEKGKVTGYQEVLVDEGEEDKRLLVVEPEFARVLLTGQRSGNTLSPVIRKAWDSGDLNSLTRNSPARATGAHISIIGHITLEELRRALTEVEVANGFANRFIFMLAKRSKELPDPEVVSSNKLNQLATKLAGALEFARTVDLIERDEEAGRLWREIYHSLSASKPGLPGSMTARSEAQVLRLSGLYAVLDQADHVRTPHLQSALELWGYGERCVNFMFGGLFGDQISDSIMSELRITGRLTRSEIRDLFGRHASAAAIELSLANLRSLEQVTSWTEQTGGRPTEVWGLA